MLYYGLSAFIDIGVCCYVEPVLIYVCLMFAALDLTPFFDFGAQRKGRTGKSSLGFVLLDADNRFPPVFVVPRAIGV